MGGGGLAEDLERESRGEEEESGGGTGDVIRAGGAVASAFHQGFGPLTSHRPSSPVNRPFLSSPINIAYAKTTPINLSHSRGSPALEAQGYFTLASPYLPRGPGLASVRSLCDLHGSTRFHTTRIDTQGMCKIVYNK